MEHRRRHRWREHGQREDGHWRKRRAAYDRNWQAEGSAWKWRRRGEWTNSRHAHDRDRRHLKALKTCSPDSNQGLLPFHLIVEHILVRLPVRQLCQLRCVCKAWNSALARPAAGKLLRAEEEEEYWLVLVSFRRLMALSSHGCYHPLPLPNSRLRSYLLSLVESCLPCQGYCLASAGGLMCAVVQAMNGFDAVVFNCLTGSFKVLPQPVHPEKLYVGDGPGMIRLAIDAQDPTRYYVMLADSYLTEEESDLEDFEIFDSGTGSWKVGQEAHIRASASNLPHGDFFNVGSTTASNTMNVQAYHVAQDAWSTVQVPSHSIKPYRVTPGAILKYKGRILQGFLLFTDDTYGFGVWELQVTRSETGTWVEVAKTPEHLFQSRHSHTFWSVKAQGRLFYMASYCLSSGNIGPTLVYDVAHNSWCVWPSMEGVYAVALHQPMSSMYLV